MAGIRDHGLMTVPVEGATVDDSIERIEGSFFRLMSAEIRPDGIVAGSASSGIGVCVGAERAGLVVGRDLDVVSKQSSFAYLSWLRPELHVIGEDFREAGRDLARSVLGLIEGAPVSQFQRLVYGGVSPELQAVMSRNADLGSRELN